MALTPEGKAELFDLLIEAADAVRRGHLYTANRASRQAHELIVALVNADPEADRHVLAEYKHGIK